MKKQLFIRKKRQFKTLLKQIEKAKQNGTWNDLTSKTQAYLLHKLNRLYKVLKSHFTFAEWRKWVYPSFAVLGFLTMSNELSGQTLNTFEAGVALNSNGSAISAGASNPTFADLDNDTDYELYLGQFGSGSIIVENFGEFNINTMQFDASTNLIDVASTSYFDYSSPAFVDFDADGDLDLLVGIAGGGIELFLNDGSNAFALDSSVLANGTTISAGNEAKPTFVDFDGDGDLDLIVGIHDGSISLFDNTAGVGNSMVFASGTTVQANGVDIEVGTSAGTNAYASPVFGDLDEDGDLDLVIGENPGFVNFYENTAGIGNSMTFNTGVRLQAAGVEINAGLATVAIVDLDQDGVDDLIVGEATGALTFFKGTSSNLAVSEFDNQNHISLHPNPAELTVTIDTNIDINSVELFDLSGKQIEMQLVNTNQIDISNLSSGFYLIKIYDMNGRITTKQIVKK